jgi:4-hydroxy-tetrahydrodipicolinate synthase
LQRRNFLTAMGLGLATVSKAAATPAQGGLTRERYRGVFAYPATPFADDYSLDETALRSNLRKLIRIGVDGIVLAGSTGEFYTLSDADHRRIAEILREETRGKDVASVIGAQGLNPGDILRRAQAAMDVGVDAVLAMQPFYNTLTQPELAAFWEQFCRACPKIGVIIYHFEKVKQPYPPETFRKLAHLPNLLGSKEAHYDFQQWLTLQKESPLVHMSATDAWMVDLYRLKAPGLGSVNLSLMPHIVHRVLQLCGEGKFYDAERALMPFTEGLSRLRAGLQGRSGMLPVELEGLGRYGGVARSKALVNAFGFLQVGPPRPPAIRVPDDLVRRLRDYVHERYPELAPPANFAETIPPGYRLWPRPAS